MLEKKVNPQAHLGGDFPDQCLVGFWEVRIEFQTLQALKTSGEIGQNREYAGKTLMIKPSSHPAMADVFCASGKCDR